MYFSSRWIFPKSSFFQRKENVISFTRALSPLSIFIFPPFLANFQDGEQSWHLYFEIFPGSDKKARALHDFEEQ